MDSSHKNCKRSCPEHVQILEQHSYDWLSNLPIDIIHHILSFLNTAEVEKTSLLSRKWRYIWTSVPHLNFDFRGFWNREHCLVLSYDECLSKFWEFVKWALIIRDTSPIHRLQLLCDYFDGEQLKLLFSLCNMRNVQELDLLAGYEIQHCPFSRAFPEPVLAIRQNCNGLANLQSLTAFGNLKTLHLVKVRFPDDADITEKLFSDCGILENLSLEYCCFLMIKVLNVSAHKLRKLNFVNMGPNNRCRSTCNFKDELKVHTPNLVSFCYIGPMIQPCEFSDMSFLSDALIHVQFEIYPRVPCPALGAIVSGIHPAKQLSLSAVFVLHFSPAYGRSCCKVIPFDYLRCLKLDLPCDADHTEGLINLLKLSPNLEVLCIKFIECWETSCWKSREEDVACLSHHLKEIDITEFHDSTYSLEFVKFFLQNGKSLEKIKITPKKLKLNPKKLYALQAVQLASEAVSVSLASISASGKMEMLQFVYGKYGVSVCKKARKLKIKSKRNMRIAGVKSGSSTQRR